MWTVGTRMKADAPVGRPISKLWRHTLYFHDESDAKDKCAEWIRCNQDGVFEYKVMEVLEPEPVLKQGYALGQVSERPSV